MNNYQQEIEFLKKSIQEKQNLLSHLKNLNESSPSLYKNYNKSVYDRVKFLEQRKLNSEMLQSQLSEKFQKSNEKISQKNLEIQSRLEDLKNQKKEALKNEIFATNKARSYKADLDTQIYLQSCIKADEKTANKQISSQKNDPPPNSVTPLPPYSVLKTNFTKKNPKTIFYNPITGDLQDTSNILTENLTGKITHKKSESLFLPYFKNFNKVVPEFSGLSAFQQPKYTKSHPKLIQSFPVTGYGNFFMSGDRFENYHNK